MKLGFPILSLKDPHTMDWTRPAAALALLALPVWFTPAAAAPSRIEHVAPVLFELQPNARYASTDLGRWEVFTRKGVQFGRDLSVEYLGADARMRMEGVGAGTAKLSVYQGNDRSRWRPDCASFQAVAYRGLYPGIDLVYRRMEGKLKGDFILEPGADPSRIRFRFTGGTARVASGPQGEHLEILGSHSSRERLEERIPSVYETGGGRVSAHYRQYPDGSIGFEVTGHDSIRQLVIDPDLAFSTFLAGSMLDQVTATIYSPAESMLLVTGWTESSDLFGAAAGTFKGSTDGFYGRFAVTSSGVTLSSLTLFGGSGLDKPAAIAVNINGAVVIGGSTTSANFPTLNPFQLKLKGSSDGFLIQFNAFGATISSSTYMGGVGTDQITAVAITGGGTVYFAGVTSSASGLPIANAFQSTFRGGATDGFVGTLSSGVIGYCTYLGGSGSDSIAGIGTLDNEVFLTGATDSFDFPVRNAFQPSPGGGQDAFLTKLNNVGQLSYSTYLGGNGGYTGSPETGNALAVTPGGEVYVAGTTSSTNFPVARAAQAQANFRYGVTDAFLAKFTPSGGLYFSTYWGGSSWDQANAVTILPSGYVAIGGMTSSLDFPTLSPIGAGPGPTGPYDGSTYAGSYDGFVAVFSPVGALYWSTYLGGSGSDSVNGLTSSPIGEIFAGGLTGSYNFPKVNALQSNISSSGYHGFISRIGLARAQHGVFRPSAGQFYMVRNSDFVALLPIANYTTIDWSNVSGPDAIPVVGDWDNTGRTRLGLFRPSTGNWFLDINGDDIYTPGVDRMITNFGAGAYPVVGDWDNTGRTRLGYFSGGLWFLDINGDNAFDYAHDWVKAFGVNGDVPVVGDWTNTGRSRIGVFRGGLWYLDLLGNFTDQGISAIAGASTDNPVFADWNNSGLKRIGNYRTSGYPIGWWFVDINSDFAYSGTPTDAYYIFGGTADLAVVGVRSH